MIVYINFLQNMEDQHYACGEDFLFGANHVCDGGVQLLTRTISEEEEALESYYYY